MRSNKQILSLAISVIAVTILVMYMVGCGQQQAEIEKQKEIARLVIEEAWNKGDVDVLDEVYAADFVLHRSPYPDIEDLEGLKGMITGFHTWYPGLQSTIDEIIVQGETTAVRHTFRGTHKGQGKQVTFSGCTVSHRVDGKVVEEWVYWDDMGLYQQLGYKMSPPITESTFARVTVTQTKLDKIDDSVKLYQESVVPAAKAQKGFRGIMLLSDRKTGKGYSIAMWDSEEDAIANEQSGYYKAQVDKFKDFLTAKPIREGYVVTVQE